MPGGRRGLVAPQNTFLETLIKRASAQAGDTGFILCNAQIVDFPVVYCSEEFSKLLGFPRSDVMRNSIRCELMGGALTEESTIGKTKTLSQLTVVTIITFVTKATFIIMVTMFRKCAIVSVVTIAALVTM